MLMRFEDLLIDPETRLRQVCDFCRIDYDKRQLDPTIDSGVRLLHETWKEKINSPIDASRAFAWRKKRDDPTVDHLTALMRRRLAVMGYPESEGPGLAFPAQVNLHIQNAAVLSSRVPVAVAYRIGRFLKK